MLEAVPDGVLLCDARGRIEYANRRLAQLTGYTSAELTGADVEMLVPEGVRGRHREDRRHYQLRPRPRPMGTVENDFRVRRKDGTSFSADIALGPVGGARGRQVMAVVRDITARKELEAELAHLALHDPLTGLANRTLFFDRLHQAMRQARRDRKQVGLVMLDLDHFKDVNDAFGHQTGDEVLRRLAVRLRAGLRSTDTVARLGGDEFAWVLPNIGGRQAAMVMMVKLLRAVPSRVTVGRRPIEVGVSAGLALFPDDGDDVDTLMRVADVELYAAKRHAPTKDARTAY
ncbi:MAG TPA: diguanylate cyclase [Candidatus Dormibacteraeota bacterium]|nr:diguanylate cyclase [Candidatus Dormibacteraeota bacterium]